MGRKLLMHYSSPFDIFASLIWFVIRHRRRYPHV